MKSSLSRNLLLALSDAACTAAVWALVVCGYQALGFGHHYVPSDYLRFWPVIPLYLALNNILKLYHGRFLYPAAPLSPVEEMRRLIGSSFAVHAGVLVWVVLDRQTTQGVSRFIIVMSGLLIGFLAPVCREVVRGLMAATGVGSIPVVIVGDGRALEQAAAALKNDGHTGFRPVGYFTDDERESLSGVRRLGGWRDVVRVSRALDVRVMVACDETRFFHDRLAEFAKWFTYIEYLPTARVFPIWGSKAVTFGGIGGIEMVNQGRMRLLRVEKWLLDRVLSLVAFVIWLPFILVIALLVKLTSKGPAFYGHVRLGKGGRKFSCWKFRTMAVDADERLRKLLAEDPQIAAEWAANFKLKDDPRVTPFGRILRKTSLDELPQFINVLCGTMALVGPRPIVEGEKKFYGDAYEILASVRPGMTGLWQVSGRSDTSYARRVALDSEYVLNWSPWLDLWILFRTFVAVITLRGAR